MLILLMCMPILYDSAEVNIAVCTTFVIILFNDLKPQLPKDLLNVIAPLVLILIIASLSSFFFKWELYDIFKDFVYLLKPILFILLGYKLVSKIKDKSYIYKCIIYLAIIFAIIHIVKVFYLAYLYGFEVNKTRGFAGKSNYLEMLAIFLLFANTKRHDYFQINLKNYKLTQALLMLSFVLYFSRTMFVGLFLIFLAFKGYSKITTKGLAYFTSIIVLIFGFYWYLNSLDLERGSTGMEGFLYKIKIAPSEIFNADVDTSTKNHAALWDHWRAFEAKKAIDQLLGTSYYLGLFFGQGIGSLVDLGFKAPLGNIAMQHIPKIHNGLVYVTFKAGILGLICYISFLANLYLYAYRRLKNNMSKFANNFISGIGLYFMFTSLIITGIYNQGDILTIVLGGLIGLKSNYKYFS